MSFFNLRPYSFRIPMGLCWRSSEHELDAQICPKMDSLWPITARVVVQLRYRNRASASICAHSLP